MTAYAKIATLIKLCKKSDLTLEIINPRNDNVLGCVYYDDNHYILEDNNFVSPEERIVGAREKSNEMVELIIKTFDSEFFVRAEEFYAKWID